MKVVSEYAIPFHKKLNNGILMPRVGFGTYKIKDLDKLVYQAIKNGVHHFDTATLYENETEIGIGINNAINDNLCKREDIFVVTKLWHDKKNDVEGALRDSLQRLKLDYIDLWLVHWPMPGFKKNSEGKLEFGPSNYEVWRNMESMVGKGLVKSIGVCNFGVQLLLDLLTYAKIKPVTNQIEYHPYLTQPGLIKFCQEQDIVITAYNSLVKGVYNISDQFDLLKEPIVIQLSEKYKVSPGQIALNWALSQDVLVIPSSSKAERCVENLNSLSFKMSAEDIALISALDKRFRLNPSSANDFFNYIDMFV